MNLIVKLNKVKIYERGSGILDNTVESQFEILLFKKVKFQVVW